MHGTEAVSAWVARWSHLVAPDSTVLDLACGAGRHTLHFLRRDCKLTGVDRAQDALDAITAQLGTEQAARCQLVCADIENGPWPLAGMRFDAVVVTHYLWRPLWPDLIQSLQPGGYLIYETFSQGHETIGKPSRPDFLLREGELLDVARSHGLQVVAYECGFLDAPDRLIQRIVAIAPGLSSDAQAKPHTAPRRHRLMPGLDPSA